MRREKKKPSHNMITKLGSAPGKFTEAMKQKLLIGMVL